MRILLIRHGDPDYEHDTLTEKGRREAELLAKRASSLAMGSCYQSPLGRAMDTAQPCLKATGKDAEVLEWLREFPAQLDLNKDPELSRAYPGAKMADGVPIRAAGGLEDGGFGTSYEKIANAIEEIYSDDGVIVLMDMGSAVMTAEMVLEAMPERKLILADCPLVEGAVAATVSAIAGSSLDEIMDELPDVRELKKLS